MALDLTTALNSYGFFGQIANAIPELKSILTQAQQQEWMPEQFTRALNDSTWWKSNADSIRKLAILNATDPATYNQNLANAAGKIRAMASQMGRSVDADTLALQALSYNWDDEVIRHNVGSGALVNEEGRPGALAGDAGQILTHMSKLTTDFGVPASQDWMNQWVTRIQSGQDSIDGFESLVKARAKAQFPHLANQIDGGMTVRDIADPYIASYAQTLEVPETAVTMKDPAIQQALQTKNPDGTFSTKPMYEFVRQLKEDPRWDNTKNATDEAYRFTNRLGKDMGFLS